MATTEQPNGDVQLKIVERLDGVPAIHDSVTYAHSLIQGHQLTAQIYQIASGIASKSYGYATPVISRTKPLIESADGLAVATFDRAKAIAPYPFETPTQDLVGVKQAKAVYDARLAPFFNSAQPVIQDVLNKTAEINSALGARAQATLVSTIHSSQEISHALLDQLRYLAEHGQELPGALINGVGKATSDISQIVMAKEHTLQEKSNKVGAYVIDQVKPIVDEIYNYLLGAKNKAQAEVQEVTNGNAH